MKAGKKNDSPVAIFTIGHNYICLNSALAKCLLDAAFRAIDHVPHFPRTEDWAPSEPSNSSIPDSICPHACVQGLLKLTLAGYGL